MSNILSDLLNSHGKCFLVAGRVLKLSFQGMRIVITICLWRWRQLIIITICLWRCACFYQCWGRSTSSFDRLLRCWISKYFVNSPLDASSLSRNGSTHRSWVSQSWAILLRTSRKCRYVFASRTTHEPHAKQQVDEGSNKSNPEPDAKEIERKVDGDKEDDEDDDDNNDGDVFRVRMLFQSMVVGHRGSELEVVLGIDESRADAKVTLSIGLRNTLQFLIQHQSVPHPFPNFCCSKYCVSSMCSQTNCRLTTGVNIAPFAELFLVHQPIDWQR